MEMTPQRWKDTSGYLAEVFGEGGGGAADNQLRTLMRRAVAAGLPDIAVSPETGRFLRLLASMAGGGGDGRGAGLVIEVGTLAGYSGICLAHGLRAAGKLITIDINPEAAAFARAEFARAGVAERVEQRVGAALDVLPVLAKELGPGSVDLAFLDGVKTEYSEYFRHLRPMIRPGGLLVADNMLGAKWWIDEKPGVDPQRDAVDRFNRAVAADAGFLAAGVPIGNGVLVARKVR